MLERARYRPAAARTLDDQRLRHRQRPHHDGDEIAAQSAQGADPLVAVDHREPVPIGHHHDGDLLAALAEGAEKTPLHVLAAGAQRFEPQVELVELHIHGRGHKRGSAPIWSFAAG